MEVAQNDETNSDTQPVRSPHIPSIANTQLSPSGSSVRKRETPGILSRMSSPFTGTTSYRVRAHRTPRIALLYFVILLLLCYLWCSPPLLLSGRPRDRCRYPCDRLRRRRPPPSRLSNQASPPLIIPISPIPFSHACIRFCYCN